MSDERRVPADECPLCGGPNGCGLVAGKSQCWCFTSHIPQEVKDRIPDEAKGVACVCQACAEGKRSPAEVQRKIKQLTTR